MAPRSLLHRLVADNTSETSLATRLRRRRFLLLKQLLADTPGSLNVIDIGGRQSYWEMVRSVDDELVSRMTITLVNQEPQSPTGPGLRFEAGDARELRNFADGEFDLAFSNSTIEHVGSIDDQRRMANEVRRVGRLYYVQTPNRYFPIEPHFLVPCFQFLPVWFRIWLVRHFNLGWYRKHPDAREARALVEEIRLLKRSELVRLFPGGTIHSERFLGLVKSFVVTGRVSAT